MGMLRLLKDEVEEALKQLEETPVTGETGALQGKDGHSRRLTIATGVLAAPFIKEQMDRIREKFPCVEARVIAVENTFFGEQITVAGLLTGQDLREQLKGRELGETLLLSGHMLRSGERVFLDDMTVAELEKALQVPITIVKSDGKALVEAVLGRQEALDELL